MSVQAMEALRHAQAMNALKRANAVRVRNSETFQEVAALPRCESAAAIAEILRSPDEWQAGMRIGQLVLSARGVGPDRATRMLRAAGVTLPGRRVRDLSERQRVVLAEELRAFGMGTTS